MSTDWNVVCDKCKMYSHLGQRMGGLYTFGWGSKDDVGREKIGEFISDHVYHSNLRIVLTDDLPEGYKRYEV